VQEAKAAGLPVLAPDAGGVRDLIEPGATGWLFDATSEHAGATALRERIRAWRDDPGLRRRMGLAARASTRGRTWPAVCDELLGHYGDLVGSADGSRGAHHLVTHGSAARRPGPVDTAA
jgi:phosphatidylinositol alpha 1,6-mannosyltransferase